MHQKSRWRLEAFYNDGSNFLVTKVSVWYSYCIFHAFLSTDQCKPLLKFVREVKPRDHSLYFPLLMNNITRRIVKYLLSSEFETHPLLLTAELRERENHHLPVTASRHWGAPPVLLQLVYSANWIGGSCRTHFESFHQGICLEIISLQLWPSLTEINSCF